MFSKRSIKSLTIAMLTTAILFCGTCIVMGQDSKPAAGADKNAVWTDSATGLTWTVKDNGDSVSPNQGHQYCSSLRTGGFSDWRLPKIDELEAIFDSKQTKQYKAKGSIDLSDACVLSGSTNPSGDAWTFCFNSGSRNLGGGGGCGTTARALCVRGAAK